MEEEQNKYNNYLIKTFKKMKTTKEIKLPKNPLDKVIGQEKAVKIAKLAVKQRRHLLLIGPPGTGKSMLAKAMAHLLPKPKQQISVLKNPKRPERPILLIEKKNQLKQQKNKELGKLLEPFEVPPHIAEELGFRCSHCGTISDPSTESCPYCGRPKTGTTPFKDLLPLRKQRKTIVRDLIFKNGKKEVYIYEVEGSSIRKYTEEEYKQKLSEKFPDKKVIVPINRNTFVEASGASISELLGDVQHDPYGGHPEIGIPHHLRVVAGAIHEAHEGVLYIDEIAFFSYKMQKSLLTAMQEKKFPIAGRNTTSTGAAVKVENVPSDFILVGAANITDLKSIIPPLRNRIRGYGYEIVMETVMKENELNKAKIAQFTAQEIEKDKKIPHATKEAVYEIINMAKKLAHDIDKEKGLTLRLRHLSGVIRAAGDLAVYEGSTYIEKKHVLEVKDMVKSIEEQLVDKYGSLFKAASLDLGIAEKPKGDTR